MTALRPERPSGGAEPSSCDYESTGQFAAAVDGLADPLNDPLPGRGNPAAPGPQPYGVRAEVTGHEPAPAPRRQDVENLGGYGQPQPQPQHDQHQQSQQPQRRRQQRQPQPGGPQPQQPYEAVYEAPAWYGSPTPVRTPEPVAPPQPESQPSPESLGSQPSPESPESLGSAQPPSRGRRRRAVDGAHTAVMSTLDPPDDTPSRAAEHAPQAPETHAPGRAARRRAAAAGSVASVAAGSGPAAVDTATGSAVGVATGVATGAATGAVADAAAGTVPGGRAARRKAAQQASRRGGRRARGRATGTTGQTATTGTTAAEQAAEGAAAPRSRVEARRAARAAKDSPGVVASRIVGELFITFGVLMLLFVTYQLWWSNILADQEAGGAAKTLQNEWNSGDSEEGSNFTTGQNFAIIYIPKLDVKAPIAQGVGKTQVLDKGMVGHYDGAPFNTAMPWDKTGNFALAAHRNTHGEPFRYINKLVKGDKVVVETESTYYTYAITSMLPQTSPSNTSVIRPVPTGSGFTKPGRYITLTTCTPEFTSTYRLIVWGELVSQQPRSKGTPAVLQGG